MRKWDPKDGRRRIIVNIIGSRKRKENAGPNGWEISK
jgi:hypothetical protein